MLQSLRHSIGASRAALAAGAVGLAAVGATVWETPFSTAAAKSPEAALSPKEWRVFKLASRKQLTHNTHFYRFELPEGTTAGLTTASCLVTKGTTPAGETVIRPYTPTSLNDAVGHLDFVVKVYEKGNMSKIFGDLKVGESIEMKGPIPKLPYEANKYKEVGMIAGGSGITPMLQIIQESLRDPRDKTRLSLIFANVEEKDIIMKDRLDELAAKHSDRFSVYYVLNKPPKGIFGIGGWKGGEGHVSKEHIRAHMPAPKDGSIVCVCGPPPMMNAISGDKNPDKSQGEVQGMLKDLGYTSDTVYKF
ncbi:unnamed protein product [Pedinophyceae sp. YPF-701]|nr:unnamed protein product [Pedinophyceae sp. YPF-701]